MIQCIDFVLNALESAGLGCVPAGSSMEPAPTSGIYYTGLWEEETGASLGMNRGLLRMEFAVVDTGLADAVETAEQLKKALSDAMGLRLVECRNTGFVEGDKARVKLLARMRF